MEIALKKLDRTLLEESLARLGQALAIEGEYSFEIVVCGGSAMLTSRAVDRVTRDVDVIALIERDKEVSAKPLPDQLVSAVKRVARDLDLPERWLNDGPADMQRWGLPQGWQSRAIVKNYGQLTVHFFAPQDLIPLKLFDGKHLDDLRALKPTQNDILAAAQWCTTQDPSPGFYDMLVSVLEQLGFHDALERFSEVVDRPES